MLQAIKMQFKKLNSFQCLGLFEMKSNADSVDRTGADLWIDVRA